MARDHLRKSAETSRIVFADMIEFIRERGVAGLAIGFVFGTQVQKLVTAFVTDIISPLISLTLGRADTLLDFKAGPFLVGDFISSLLDFLILLFIIYLMFRGFRLDRLEKK